MYKKIKQASTKQNFLWKVTTIFVCYHTFSLLFFSLVLTEQVSNSNSEMQCTIWDQYKTKSLLIYPSKDVLNSKANLCSDNLVHWITDSSIEMLDITPVLYYMQALHSIMKENSEQKHKSTA